MGMSTKSKSKNTDKWGLGFFLVFFTDDNASSAAASSTSSAIPFSSSSSFPASSPSQSSPRPNYTKTFKRTNSNNPILNKTQSTISICALLLFLTLLLFTLSSFEPTTNQTPRRFLSQKSQNTLQPIKTHIFWFTKMWKNTKTGESLLLSHSFALQGMGKLYRRGTRAMSDLIVAHLVEDINGDEFKLFLRVLHRSGLTARADIVFVFPSSSSVSRFEALIREENDSFLKLVHRHKIWNSTSRDSVASFDVTQFVKKGDKAAGEPLWGKRFRANSNNNNNNNFNELGESGVKLTRLSYGSVVGFEASELDPENSLAGFLDHVPMSLRRWACYPMLLGRVRRNFKHIMLVDVKKLLLLGDPLGGVTNRRPESVYITIKQESTSSKHSRRNSDKTQSHCQVNSAILMGGSRGIRKLSNAMLTEIVRVAMQHKKKSSATESGILSQLVGNGHILKNIDLITSAEWSSHAGGSNSFSWDHNFIIQSGSINTNHDVNSIIMKQICSCEVDSFVYRDC